MVSPAASEERDVSTFFEAGAKPAESSSPQGNPSLSHFPVPRRLNTWNGLVTTDVFLFTFRGVEFLIHRRIPDGTEPKPDLRWVCSHGPTGMLVHHNEKKLDREALVDAACKRLIAHWSYLPEATKGKPVVNP